MNGAEIVLEVMGEGGKYTLCGESATSGLSFYVNRNESVVADLLEEDDADLRNFLNYRSDTFHSIEDALDHMGKRPASFPIMSIRCFHTIWTVVKERENPIHQAAEIIKTANRMVILTGAGMSTQSRIPAIRTYRCHTRKRPAVALSAYGSIPQKSFHHYVEKAMAEVDFIRVQRIAIDETSSRCGHRYITLFLDTETKTVLYATEGKGKETLGQFKELLTTKGVAADQIQEVCCDMSPAFIRGVEDHFPSAQITFDKFHVMKLVNEAVDDVRIEEQKHTPELRKAKYFWLKNETSLKDDQKAGRHTHD
jgi:hypothetical protein